MEMNSNEAVGILEHIRGETVTFALESEPPYTGVEVLQCDIKKADPGNKVPPVDAPTIRTIVPVFRPRSGCLEAHWLFTLTPTMTSMMEAGTYITDAKVTYPANRVDYPLPLGIKLSDPVTS